MSRDLMEECISNLTTSGAPPGSGDNPVASVSPPRPGSSENYPLVVSDSPPRPCLKDPSRRTIYRGPPSLIQPHTRPHENVDAVRSRITRLQHNLSSANENPLRDNADYLQSIRARIQACEPFSREASIITNEHRPEEHHCDNAAPSAGIPRGTAASKRAARREEGARTRKASGLSSGSSSVSSSASASGSAIRRSGTTRIRRSTRPGTVSGWRTLRLEPLTHRDLWLGGHGPREQLANPDKDHHKCGICHAVKSHPVFYLCGHSHCYVCIRLWLEREWTCPHCVTTMERAPFRHYGEEAAIAAEYPDWNDESHVDYSVDGCRIVGGLRYSASSGIYLSLDGQRRTEELLNVTHKKRCLAPGDLRDPLAQWVPGRDDDFGEEEARCPPPFEPAAVLGEDPVLLLKRKEYASTTDPMSLFRPLKGFFLEELLRHKGLGDSMDNPQCAHCSRGFTPESVLRVFKCYECGEFLQCEDCCGCFPYSLACMISDEYQEWNGNFWVPCTLRDLGLVYQLGHGGFPCLVPDETVHKMTVMEAPIIRQIHMRFCKCSKSDSADNLEQLMRNGWYPATVTDPSTCATFRSLESFRLYNVVGNMNVRDFVTAMERVTDTTAASGMTWLPDRYKQLGRMARQWAFLKRLMRAGRGHDPAGVGNTKLGECAVICWACPQDGRNLPPDWHDVDPKYRFLYMLLLAVDTNFRLKNRMRVNEIEDPSLGPGWGYWVEPEKYKTHLKDYVNEKDLIAKADQYMHRLRRPPAKGHPPDNWPTCFGASSYANMDFIVMSALAGFTLMLLTISYDIACQWKATLPERMKKLPQDMRLPLDSIKLQCALPVWHAASHNEPCQNQNSLSFKPGVGKSDGEGVERTWAVLNPAAYATKDAGRGNRADTFEGKIDNHNYLKNVGQGEALQRKLVVAIAERDKQIKAFSQVNKTLSDDLKKAWKKMIEEWLEDGSRPNPYTLNRKDCPTEAEVRLDVRKDEDALTAGGKAPLYGRSATAFLVAGIQIEDTQRRIHSELKGSVLVAADRENKIAEWRHTLLVKIACFRTLQAIYMPGAARIIAAEEASRDTDAVPPKPEKVKLFMPSQMPVENEADTLRGCVKGLLDMEAKLRVAQCDNSLASLRSRLHAKRYTQRRRGHFRPGRGASGGIRAEISAGAGGVGGAEGGGAYPHFRALADADVRLDGDDSESDAAARKKLGMIGAGRGARAPRNAPGTSRRVMSWIWTAPGAVGQDEERLHDSWVLTRFFSDSRRMVSCPGAEGQMDGGGNAYTGRDAARVEVSDVAGSAQARKPSRAGPGPGQAKPSPKQGLGGPRARA
ncbi:hypothetical protein DFH09DRAFT_1087397 [Mycena vulgaris]|nr:hypothetical protein DFH09DRAFT_1087397 [Mycena vulgaris]